MPDLPAVGEHTKGRAGPSISSRTIVVASDGGDGSAGALVVANALAHELHAVLEVVSVLEPTNMIVPPLARSLPPLHRGATRIQERRERLRALCGRVLSGEPPFPTRLLIGDPSTTIARAAQSHGAQLIVTGRVPHGRIERAMHHETPLATVRAGGIPVLAVESHAARLPRRVVVAVGTGDSAASLAPIARGLLHDALVVHLVAVTQSASVPWEEERSDEDDARRREAEQTLREATARWRPAGDVPVETHVLTGEPCAAVADFAEVSGADLLVVGQARRTRGPHLTSTDLATRIFRTVACSMLIVPSATLGLLPASIW